MNSFVLLLSSLTICAGIDVIAPERRVLAIRGQPAILGCQFTPDSNLKDLVVTWQRDENAEVVHSFYYGTHQLDLQSPRYRNRTTLFVSELLKGNATLKIDPVGSSDAGDYQCSVNNNMGVDKAAVHLDYGAFYTEPRLSINRSGSTITLLYEAEGFPKPEVRWIGEDGKVDTVFDEEADGAGGAVGLYHVKSSYVSSSPSLNVTFTLKNQLLHQNLLRPVSIIMSGAESRHGEANNSALVVVCVLCVLLLLFIIALLITLRRTRRHRPNHNRLNWNGTNGNGTNGNETQMFSDL